MDDETAAVAFEEPGHPTRHVPAGPSEMWLSDWVEGFCLALIARDHETAALLAEGSSIASCSFPTTYDYLAFWPYYAHALGDLPTMPQRALQAAIRAESILQKATDGANSFFVLDLVPPDIVQTLFLIRCLASRDERVFNDALAEVLERHREQQQRAGEPYDWQGLIALEALALASLSTEWGMQIRVESDYLPGALLGRT
jgi:hypothetical protein